MKSVFASKYTEIFDLPLQNLDLETSKTKPVYKLSETITQDGELVVNFAKDSI